MRTQRFTGYPKGQPKPSCQAAGPPHILLWGYPQKASPYFSWKPSRWKVETMGLPSLARSSPCPKTVLAQSLFVHVNVSFSIYSPFLEIKKLPRRVLWEPCLFDLSLWLISHEKHVSLDWSYPQDNFTSFDYLIWPEATVRHNPFLCNVWRLH